MTTEVVNYFREKLHIRYLTGLRISLCVDIVVIFAPYFNFLNYDDGWSDTAVNDCKSDTSSDGDDGGWIRW